MQGTVANVVDDDPSVPGHLTKPNGVLYAHLNIGISTTCMKLKFVCDELRRPFFIFIIE
jgi:hypothetical protein